MRIVSAAEAVAHIRPGDHVHVHGACATPTVLLDALVARAAELTDVRISHLHIEGPAPHLAPEMAGHFRHLALFIGANARAAVNEGRADYIPTFLSDVPALFASGALPVDTVFLNTSRPDAHGFVSLGTSVDVMPAAIRAATHVVAQLNAAMPRTLGASFVHIDDIEYGVEVDIPPQPSMSRSSARWSGRSAATSRSWCPTARCSRWASAASPAPWPWTCATSGTWASIPRCSRMRSWTWSSRARSRASLKELDRGKIVTAFLMGGPRLWRFVDDNPMVEMRPVSYTNDTAVIRRLRRMTSINSAIEIDLTGQVVADSIGHRFYSGIGGQMDFVRGASLARDGRAIICLPSTARSGSVSRIVAELAPGAGVVTTRGHVHTVVTEFGVAELHGRTIRERARALIGIAHPDFRDELRAAAARVHLL